MTWTKYIQYYRTYFLISSSPTPASITFWIASYVKLVTFLSTFTLNNCSEFTNCCLFHNTECKCSEKFIVVLMQAYHFCFCNTNGNFYDRYWLHQFSYILFWYSHQPRVICQQEITKFVMRTLKQLYACILAVYV